MSKRYVTLEAIGGAGFRLITPFGNRDFENGILATDSDDPACEWLEDWANAKADIKVTVNGEVAKAGVKTCPVCNQQVASEAALAEHNEAVHVQPESKGQRKTTRRRKG